MFKPTYLYVKTHNVTGLKYFGKTTNLDPVSYRGSGTYWINHIKKHGYDVTTEIIGYYRDRDECVKAARKFSRDFMIVESEGWANLIDEYGVGGSGWIGVDELARARAVDTCKRKYGDDYYSKIVKGRSRTEEQRLNMSKIAKERGFGKTNAGKPKPLTTCPRCGKIGAKHTMSRWHFENCRKGSI